MKAEYAKIVSIDGQHQKAGTTYPNALAEFLDADQADAWLIVCRVSNLRSEPSESWKTCG